MNPFRTSINYLFTHQLHRCQKAAIEKFGENGPSSGNIVTNGAYTLKDWVVNERIVLERSLTYWNNAKTVINRNLFAYCF